MCDTRLRPWAGPCRRSPSVSRGHHRHGGLPAFTHSTWSLDDDLGQLQKTMLSMLTDSILSDVCLVVEGVDIFAHKAVLAAWSRPFRAMFTLPMRESQHKCRVVIKDVEQKHFMVALDYLYSGRIGLNDQNIMPVSALANRYEIMPLMSQCEGYLKWRVKPSNVCRHLLAAEEHQCASMSAFALDYLAVHFDEVHHDYSSDFNVLSADVAMRVLQHEGLTVDEETVFLAVDGWAAAWPQRRSARVSAASHGNDTSADEGRENLQPQQEQQHGEAPPENRGPCVSSSSSSTSPTSLASAETVLSGERGVFVCVGQPGLNKINPGGNNSNSSSSSNISSSSSITLDLGMSGGSTSPNVGGVELGKVNAQGGGVRSSAAAGVAVAAASTQAGRAGRDQGVSTSGSNTARNEAAAASAADDADLSFPSAPCTPVSTVETRRRMARERRYSTEESVTAPLGSMGSLQAAVNNLSPTSRPPRGFHAGVGGGQGGGSQGGVMGGGIVGRQRSLLPTPGAAEPTGLRMGSAWAAPNLRGSGADNGVENGAENGAGDSLDNGDGDNDGDVSTGDMHEDDRDPHALPEQERVLVDQLLLEVRFPLVSTSFLCQVVEQSLAMSGSRVAQSLLHEAYRYQAIRPDAADVQEHFPGNHRVKYRGHEQVLFGEGEGCVGTVDDYSSSVSEVHLVDNVQRRDEKYWLPGQPEEAYVCVRLDRVRRITKFRFQNRYSEEFEVAVRRTRREEWQVIVPRRPSGGHKDVKELDLTRKRVKARHVKISLRGRMRPCYNTSLYWTELIGF